jgi:hypothetical protein
MNYWSYFFELAEGKYMGPAYVTYTSEPYQYAQIGEAARFFCEGYIGKCFLF